MSILQTTFDRSLDRFRKLRVGQLVSDIDSNGEVDVRWLDGEAGGQSRIQISFPSYNNTESPGWGVELGHGRGVVGVFGFLLDNHAVLLTTIISKINKKGVGYDKTEKIKSGEFRITSKGGARIHWRTDGSLLLKTENTQFFLDESNQRIDVTAPNGFFVNGSQIT